MREIFIKGRARTELVVVLHGLRGSPKGMRCVSEAALEARPDADVLALPLAFGGFFGMAAIRPAERIAAQIVERIDQAMDARESETPGGYRHIILVGHSFGAVIARKVAIIAYGERGARFEPRLEAFREGRSWAGKIERIVMLGGMNRGWSPAAARNWTTATSWTLGSWAGEISAALTRGWARPTVAGIRRGAPFIVQTRLQWLALTRSDITPALVVQLLGAADDLVAPDDSVDFACDLRGEASSPFALIEVPFATHEDACRMKRPTPGQLGLIQDGIANGDLSDVCKHDDLVPQTKWHLFQWAVSRSLEQLKTIWIDPRHMADMPALQPDTAATNVVFVIHGIRDRGFWTQKIARVIKSEVAKINRGKPPAQWLHFRSFTGSYGYFAMVPFVLPWIRRWKAEWLMDHYVEELARHPNATISFVGHSNGTYLLARALKDYPAARFERVVLAGSVIRRDFDWNSRLRPQPGYPVPQVGKVLNYVATSDWVVAIFSKAFQPLRFFFDLGSAGHDGFDQCRRGPRPRFQEAHFVQGQHSAALVETQWDDIARFIINGSPFPGLPDADFRTRRNRIIVALSSVSSLILLLVLWLVIGFGVALTKSVYGAGMVEVFGTVSPWEGLTCPSEVVGRDACGWLVPAGQGVLRVVNWIWAALRGTITTPFAEAPVGGPSGFRAAVCALYWWFVYIVATRF